jgi:GMP synthase-like glutamine amidotransferase
MVLDVTTAASSSHIPPTILQRSIGGGGGNGSSSSSSSSEEEELILLFLGCEAKPPYGPYLHTATLFLDLISRALEEINTDDVVISLILKVYSVSQGHFPTTQELEDCHGVLLPGSFNSAYDEHEPWITQLKQVIQTELVAKRRPTLGVCFGHQLYAHSFEQGGAIKCPAGPQAGRQVTNLTREGQQWLQPPQQQQQQPLVLQSESELHLFYTHGDMVERLPPQGVSLGGTDQVPIQAAIYHHHSSSSLEEDQPQPPPIIAITFQAHPEYASSKTLGFDQTFTTILNAMHERGDVTQEARQQAQEDAEREFERVERHSLQTMITAGRLLGWFPK